MKARLREEIVVTMSVVEARALRLVSHNILEGDDGIDTPAAQTILTSVIASLDSVLGTTEDDHRL